MSKSDKAQQVEGIKHAANSAKRSLMDLHTLIEPLSAREALALDRIIAKLEAWQNR